MFPHSSRAVIYIKKGLYIHSFAVASCEANMVSIFINNVQRAIQQLYAIIFC